MKKFDILKTTVLTLFLGMTIHASSQTPLNTLHLQFKNQTVIDILLAEQPEISFLDSDEMNNMRITTSSNEYDIKTPDLENITFISKSASALDIINDNNANDFELSDGMLVIHASEDNADLNIYDVQSRLVQHIKLCERTASIDLSNLSHGVYIFQIGCQSIKIAIR